MRTALMGIGINASLDEEDEEEEDVWALEAGRVKTRRCVVLFRRARWLPGGRGYVGAAVGLLTCSSRLSLSQCQLQPPAYCFVLLHSPVCCRLLLVPVAPQDPSAAQPPEARQQHGAAAHGLPFRGAAALAQGHRQQHVPSSRRSNSSSSTKWGRGHCCE